MKPSPREASRVLVPELVVFSWIRLTTGPASDVLTAARPRRTGPRVGAARRELWILRVPCATGVYSSSTTALGAGDSDIYRTDLRCPSRGPRAGVAGAVADSGTRTSADCDI